MKRRTNNDTESNSGQQTGTIVAERGAVAQYTSAVSLNGELSIILSSLQTMRDGDFSVRLPGSWTGLPGKLADTFNEIAAANQQIATELKRIGIVVGKQGKTR